MQFKFKIEELLPALGAAMLVVLFWRITGLYDKFPNIMYFVVGAIAALVGVKIKAKRK